MSTPSPPYAFLRNALAVAKASSRISRSIAPCSCRQTSSTSFSPSKIQWSSNNKRAFSSTAFRAKPTPPRKDSETKDEADAQKPAEKNDERFYMPPPPEYLQQRIDAAKASMMPPPAPPPQEKPKEAEPAPIPEPENTTGPAAATAAPETLESDRDAGSSAAEQKVGEGETEAVKSAKQEAVAAEEALPSKHQAQRWKLSKRVQERMDELLAQAALVSHKVNNYTGTDYSGIERLRSDIKDQESLVKAAHAQVSAAKEAYTTSYSQQASSQKEVVGLLERKHSWSAADLERYMSLIRSEHLNEQAVLAAKEHLANAERDLEDARSKLEKKERKQYHEEQIWSDTIRRNSTWVTFGLMGLNIFLLLANLVIFEPWRRRRMVKEIKSALDEKTATVPSVVSTVEAEVDKVVEPAGQALEKLEERMVDTVEATATEVMSETASEETSETQSGLEAEAETAVGEAALATAEVLPEEIVEAVEPTPETSEPVQESIEQPTQQRPPENWEERLNLWKEIVSSNLALFRAKLQDLFSERQITVKKIDVTAIALEGAAAGVAVVGLIWALLSQR